MNALKIDAMLEVIQQVEQDLRDYSWMSARIAEMQGIEEITKKHPREVWEKVIGTSTAQYGIEASMPKPQGTNSDPTFREAQRLLRNWERLKRYDQKITQLEKAVASITDERERTVAEGLMDGERLYQIAQHLNVSRRTAYDIKQSTIRKLAIKMYGDKLEVSDSD